MASNTHEDGQIVVSNEITPASSSENTSKLNESDTTDTLSKNEEHVQHGGDNVRGKRKRLVEQILVCGTCGDLGYEHLLGICCKCEDGAEHTYCMKENLDEVPDNWCCYDCSEEVVENKSIHEESDSAKPVEKESTQELSDSSKPIEKESTQELTNSSKPVEKESTQELTNSSKPVEKESTQELSDSSKPVEKESTQEQTDSSKPVEIESTQEQSDSLRPHKYRKIADFDLNVVPDIESDD